MIEVEGIKYKVLSLDQLSKITHVKASGGIASASMFRDPDGPEHDTLDINYPNGSQDEVWVINLDFLGIQPLCLISGEKLNSCPFCDSDKVDISVSEMSRDVIYYSVQCNDCGGRSGLAKDKQDAIELWNQRCF
jgi:Lar family restriction alleviation protein